VEAATALLKEWESIICAIVGNQASIDPQETMGASLHKADLATGLRREAHVVPVSPGIFGAQRRRHRRIGETPDPAQLFADYMALQFELVFVPNVLPLAAAALPKVLARRIYPMFRSFQHLHNSPHEDTRTLVLNFDYATLSWYAVIGEHHLLGTAFRGHMCKRSSLEGHVFEGHRQALAVTFRLFPPSSSHGDSVRGAQTAPNCRARALYISSAAHLSRCYNA
jgi:hypothetical protein